MPKRNTEPALWQQKCAEWTRRVIEAMYPLCYWLGIQTIRLWHQLLRALTRVLTPWKRLVRNLWMRYVWQHVRHWGEEWKRFIDGFPLSARLISEAWKRHPLEGIWQVIRTPFLGIRRHSKGLLTVLNIAAPLLALWLAIAAISYWGNATYALQLEYKGENLGYISDESVFDEAATLAEGRVSRVDNSFAIERTPVLTVTLAQEDALLNETELCDIILQSYGNAVEKSSGLYVNDTFVGTVSSPQKAQALLQAEGRTGGGPVPRFHAAESGGIAQAADRPFGVRNAVYGSRGGFAFLHCRTARPDRAPAVADERRIERDGHRTRTGIGGR